MTSIKAMLLPLTPTRHAAWCDRCLRGSEVITFDAPTVARFFAIERLRAAGWLHVAHLGPGRDDSERNWSSETYCPDCSCAVTSPRTVPPNVIGSQAPHPLKPHRSSSRDPSPPSLPRMRPPSARRSPE